MHLLTGPYLSQRPLPIDDVARIASDVVLDSFEFPYLNDGQVARHIAADVIDIMDALELAGMLRRVDLPDIAKGDDADLGARRRRHGGKVELTPAGVATTRRLLVDAGYDAPSGSYLSGATATELLLGVPMDDFTLLWGEMEAWRRQRTPAQAAHELARAVAELDDPALQNLALAALADIDPEIAGPEVRNLLAEPRRAGTHCAGWSTTALRAPIRCSTPRRCRGSSTSSPTVWSPRDPTPCVTLSPPRATTSAKSR